MNRPPKRNGYRLDPKKKETTPEGLERQAKIYAILSTGEKISMWHIGKRIGLSINQVKHVVAAMTFRFPDIAETDDGKIFLTD